MKSPSTSSPSGRPSVISIECYTVRVNFLHLSVLIGVYFKILPFLPRRVGLKWGQVNGQGQPYLILAIILSTSCPPVPASSVPAISLTYKLKHPGFYPIFGQCSPPSSMFSQIAILRIWILGSEIFIFGIPALLLTN